MTPTILRRPPGRWDAAPGAGFDAADDLGGLGEQGMLGGDNKLLMALLPISTDGDMFEAVAISAAEAADALLAALEQSS